MLLIAFFPLLSLVCVCVWEMMRTVQRAPMRKGTPDHCSNNDYNKGASSYVNSWHVLSSSHSWELVTRYFSTFAPKSKVHLKSGVHFHVGLPCTCKKKKERVPNMLQFCNLFCVCHRASCFPPKVYNTTSIASECVRACSTITRAMKDHTRRLFFSTRGWCHVWSRNSLVKLSQPAFSFVFLTDSAARSCERRLSWLVSAARDACPQPSVISRRTCTWPVSMTIAHRFFHAFGRGRRRRWSFAHWQCVCAIGRFEVSHGSLLHQGRRKVFVKALWGIHSTRLLGPEAHLSAWLKCLWDSSPSLPLFFFFFFKRRKLFSWRACVWSVLPEGKKALWDCCQKPQPCVQEHVFCISELVVKLL